MKRVISVILISITLCFNFLIINAYAAVYIMPDGGAFDAEFYGTLYPDAVELVGNSEEALYNHYLLIGKSEGRLNYANSNSNLYQIKQNYDLNNPPKIIRNHSKDPSAYASVLSAYMELPASYRAFLEKNNVRVDLYDSDRELSVTVKKKIKLYNMCFPSSLIYPAQPFLLKEALYHELGHAFDNIQKEKTKKTISMQDPFPEELRSQVEKAAMMTLKFNGITINSASGTRHGTEEIIAVLAESYFANPTKLMQDCPYGYTYAEKYFGLFK